MKQNFRSLQQRITKLKQFQFKHDPKPSDSINRVVRDSKLLIQCNKQIAENGRNGNVNEAELVFHMMPVKNTASWTAMLTVYAQNGQIENARKAFDQTPQRTTVSYNAMISAYIRNGCNVAKAYELFLVLSERNLVSYAAMITGFVKAGKFHMAEELYLQAPHEFRDPACSNALINGYLKAGEVNEAMPEGMQIHGLVSRLGFELESVLSNSMITMYCMFGCTDMADKVFCILSDKDIVTWNSLISGYVHNNEVEAAYRVFESMPEKNLISWTTMITGFTKSGRIGNAIQLFNMLPVKDDFVWTTIISGFVNNKEYEEALHWYARMIWECRPNPLTISSVLTASAALVALNEGLQIHTCILKMNLEYHLSVQNSLISFYSKCGNVIDAHRIFLDVIEPNVISYNSIINGFGQNGFGKEALGLLDEAVDLIRSMPFKPHSGVWGAILGASNTYLPSSLCSRAGFIFNQRFLDAPVVMTSKKKIISALNTLLNVCVSAFLIINSSNLNYCMDKY
ncbi:Pentatricopeptide repeat-containing protein [Vigna angularis]|uniref:Pentatricopeptide repeat-containing protein n=1 Tax=Phaseolus angularis TaxID=3914 RepID=A0A8T0JJB0_PHAAN|nr:Pentatricopeptide repeat-containing protein [Vigna angularis]